MSLAAGTRLGPYEILAPLGAGGMGEVYRARDPRLGREVAIKVLPADLQAHPDRLQRFELEARAVGGLNHPNLLTVFDIGSHESAPFIVFELLEGDTLRDAYSPGSLSPRKALAFAVQIAQGLGAAHDKGVVHRDLKPENLFVTDDGRVKILDFGLAKLRPDFNPEEAGSDVATRSALTGPGVMLGTVGYMSPEQVQGLPADARSDIFSFGAVLYEMLAGRRAFSASSAVSTMHAILEKDPPPLAEAGLELPPALEPIVMRCLEKRPEGRFQSARDLAFALDAIARGSASRASLAGVSAASMRSPTRSWLTALAGAIALAVAFLAAVRLGYLRSPWAADPAPPSYTRLTFNRGTVDAARFAPDGQTVVYSAAWNGKPDEIFTTRAGATESRGFDLAGAKLLAVSSPGELAVALRWEQVTSWGGFGTLARVSLAGGTPREIHEIVNCADWSPDGQSLAVAWRSGDSETSIEFPIGTLIYKTPFRGNVSAIRVSPDGRLLAFLEHKGEGVDLAVVDQAGHEKFRSGRWKVADGLAWSRSGDEVFFSAARIGAARALYAVSQSGRERLVARIAGPLSLLDLTPDGRALVTHDNTKREMVGRLAGDTSERDLSWLDWSWPVDLSADGRTLLFSEGREGSRSSRGSDLYLRTGASTPVRLGEMGDEEAPLSPDGKWALVIKDSKLERLPTGAGEAKKVALEGIEPLEARWFPDGKRVLVVGRAPGRPSRTHVVDLESGKVQPITPEGAAPELISADGGRIMQENFQPLLIFPLGGGDPVPFKGDVSLESWAMRWSTDGRFVFSAEGGLPARIVRFDLATGRKEPWKELMLADAAGVRDIWPKLITPDGRYYVYTYVRSLSDLYLAEGFK